MNIGNRPRYRSALFGALGFALISTLGLACGDGGQGPSDTNEDTLPTPLDGRGGGVLAYSKQPAPGSGVHEMFGINLDGSGDKRLVSASIGLNHEDWAPNAQRLAATGYVSESTWSIYVFNADGTGLNRLTNTDGVRDVGPAWAPDGVRIAFSRTYPQEGGRSEIWVMNADGGDQHSLNVDGFAARWSPDGQRLAFAANRGNGWNLYLVNADGSDESQLTTMAGDEMDPSWSPDGMRIAFTSNGDGDMEVYVMAADGTNLRQLTSNSADDYVPRWSADGSRIAFHSDLPVADHWEIYVMSADGTNVTRVTQTAAPRTAISAAWRPAGG
jgi:Tol biopolymer transport system component